MYHVLADSAGERARGGWDFRLSRAVKRGDPSSPQGKRHRSALRRRERLREALRQPARRV